MGHASSFAAVTHLAAAALSSRHREGGNQNLACFHDLDVDRAAIEKSHPEERFRVCGVDRVLRALPPQTTGGCNLFPVDLKVTTLEIDEGELASVLGPELRENPSLVDLFTQHCETGP